MRKHLILKRAFIHLSQQIDCSVAWGPSPVFHRAVLEDTPLESRCEIMATRDLDSPCRFPGIQLASDTHPILQSHPRHRDTSILHALTNTTFLRGSKMGGAGYEPGVIKFLQLGNEESPFNDLLSMISMLQSMSPMARYCDPE